MQETICARNGLENFCFSQFHKKCIAYIFFSCIYFYPYQKRCFHVATSKPTTAARPRSLRLICVRSVHNHCDASKDFAPELLCTTTATCPRTLRLQYALTRAKKKKKPSINWISNCNSSVSLASECEFGIQTTRHHFSCV